jgi:hypothetical protein
MGRVGRQVKDRQRDRQMQPEVNRVDEIDRDRLEDRGNGTERETEKRKKVGRSIWEKRGKRAGRLTKREMF